MSTATRSRTVKRASHGMLSLVAGFLTGLVMFITVGATIGDAFFSALALAILVATSRTLTV